MRKTNRLKSISLHLCLVFLVLSYAFFGGMVFNHLEGEVYQKTKEMSWQRKTDCARKVLSTLKTWAVYEPWRNHTMRLLSDCFHEEPDARNEWSFLTATLYGFGYNRIAPATVEGRMFCIIYGLCGIPVTMIIIANIGRYLHTFAGVTRKKMEDYRTKNFFKTKEEAESSTEMTSLFLLFVFLVYVSFGAILLPALNGQVDFFNGLYYNFICLTALDFGQLVPTKMYLLPVTFLYVCLGLAITTIAIEIGSEYMRKLHYLGEKIKNVASTKIRFGSKNLAVKDLLHAVGKKCGIEARVIDGLDLDTIVEHSIAVKEGKALEDGIEAPQSVEPTPIFDDIMKELFCNLNSPLKVQKVDTLTLNQSIIMTPPPVGAFEDRQFFDILTVPDVEIVESHQPMEAVPLQTPTPRSKFPKGFQEKKELAKKDPKKLYETYQAEWKRRKTPSKKK